MAKKKVTKKKVVKKVKPKSTKKKSAPKKKAVKKKPVKKKAAPKPKIDPEQLPLPGFETADEQHEDLQAQDAFEDMDDEGPLETHSFDDVNEDESDLELEEDIVGTEEGF